MGNEEIKNSTKIIGKEYFVLVEKYLDEDSDYSILELIEQTKKQFAEDLIKSLMKKNPTEEADKYFAEMTAKGKDKFFYSDFVMFVRDNFIKEEVKRLIKNGN